MVLSRQEVESVFAQLAPPHDLVVQLLYGCGLRISECRLPNAHCGKAQPRRPTSHAQGATGAAGAVRAAVGGPAARRPQAKPTANNPYRPSCFALQGQLNYCIVAGRIVDKHRSSGPQAAPLYLTDHRVVFRARSAEAEFTISDWASNERGGPVRRRPMHSYIEIQP